MLCPKDFKPCCDDLCRASNVCFDLREAMYDKCPGCGNLVSEDDHEDCTCEYDPFEDEDDYPDCVEGGM